MAEETPPAETPSDPAAEFASLMAGAAAAEADPAPYGYTKDRKTGEIRPKKRAGRGGAAYTPSLEELKAAGQQSSPESPEGEDGEARDQPELDRAPSPLSRRGRRRRDRKPEQPVPQYRQGVIAAGMNRLYRRTGKILQVMDPLVGQAVIEATRKYDDDDVTVGEAWEELARTNPRIRRFLLKAMAGGAWTQLVMAHGPILLAILMKDSVRGRLPGHRLIEAFFSPDETADAGPGPGDLSDVLSGLQSADLAQMMEAAQAFTEQMTRGGGLPRTPTWNGDPQPDNGDGP